MSESLQRLKLETLKVSPTAAQAERRRHFDKEGLKVLAENIRQVGLIHPIVARKVNGHYEIVAGERRFVASKQAGLEDVPVIVRELTDAQALEIQLVENLQREGLHELAEAEGYRTLQKELGYSVEDLMAKIGRSRSYVFGRLKLLELCKEAREAFYAGDLAASTALLIARIPDEAQQQRALKKLTEKDWADRLMPFRDAQKYVQETFMLKLSEAPFPREDATLVPSAGACGVCPMRTGNAPADLFGDVKGADVCTNSVCYGEKKAAHSKRELEKAAADGQKVIKGAEAKRILPDTRGYGYSSDGSHKQLRGGFARPSDKCLTDPKKRTYAELAGKDAPKVLLQNPETGRVEKVFKIEEIAPQLKEKGVKPAPVAKDPAESRAQDEASRKLESEREVTLRHAVFRAAMKAAPKKFGHAELVALLNLAMDGDGYYEREGLFKLMGWPAPKDYFREAHLKCLAAMSESELAQFAAMLPGLGEALESYGQANALNALAKKFRVDVKKVRAAADAPTKAETVAPAPAIEKKAAPAKPAAKAVKKKPAPVKAKSKVKAKGKK